MRTAGEIALRALTRSGVLASGETPTAAEIRDAITTLSDMLDAWSLERLAVFGTTLMILPSGRERITIGPSGDVVGIRPTAFVSGYARQAGQDAVVHQASNAYIDAVMAKNHRGDGHWLSFEGTMPNATVRIWPVPASGELHVRVTGPITSINDAADLLDLPPGWYQALTLNLAVHLCGEYGFPVTPDLSSLAQAAKSAIKRANLQPAVSTFDPALVPGGAWFTDPGSVFGGPGGSSLPRIAGAPPASVEVGESFTFTTIFTDGAAPYTPIISGPSWITHELATSTTGLVTIEAPAVGSYSVSVGVIDSAGAAAANPITFFLEVVPATAGGDSLTGQLSLLGGDLYIEAGALLLVDGLLMVELPDGTVRAITSTERDEIRDALGVI